MVFHVGRFFPERFLMMEEPAVLDTVRAAIDLSRGHGLVLQRDVCRYLNCMLVLGSRFDRDPRYGWVNTLLYGSGTQDASQRMSQVNARMMKVAEVWGPSTPAVLVERLAELERNSRDIAEVSRDFAPDAMLGHLRRVFHQDIGCFASEDVDKLVELGRAQAESYQLTTAEERWVYIALALLLGSGFAEDPQYPWIRTALGRAGESKERRMHGILIETMTRTAHAIRAKKDQDA